MSEETSVAYKLFHRYFKCYMPQFHLYSEEYIEKVGIPTSGDRVIDRELANAPVLCQLTAAEMATHLANGANLTLENPKDSVVLYQLVSEHLTNWQHIVNDPLDHTEPPLEDLKKFDELASELYKTARVYLNEDQLGNRLFKGLAALESNRAIDRHKPDPKPEPSFTLPKEYRKVTDLIGKAAFKKNRQWFDRDKP